METRDKVNLLFVLTLCLFLCPTGIGIASAGEEVVEGGITDSAWIAISAGIVIAEKPEVLARVLILVLFAGVIVVFGPLIAFMLWTKI